MDAMLLGPVSALAGALIGGGTSLAVAAYNQCTQQRLQRIANGTSKPESVCAYLMMNASKLLVHAFVQEQDALVVGEAEQRVIGLINRMRLFASPEVIHEAAAALKVIIEISFKPGITLGQLARDALAHTPDPDPFLRFCLVCRATSTASDGP